eukprot:gnl/TRDRNA2_/TRDRNA2_176893_c0_seq16.p1 gnl/TRDRNA2_/TRDRNA2_176893_c0~~gnl/TRDRNA2_/TRDRNA2_176893_c0_seq16.p1  ORF type:complete len:428 (+),score=101.61 gnl/TRDRNA2_/TRDRNA2_176893_c0_seq16:158-1285(+)
MEEMDDLANTMFTEITVRDQKIALMKQQMKELRSLCAGCENAMRLLWAHRNPHTKVPAAMLKAELGLKGHSGDHASMLHKWLKLVQLLPAPEAKVDEVEGLMTPDSQSTECQSSISSSDEQEDILDQQGGKAWHDAIPVRGGQTGTFEPMAAGGHNNEVELHAASNTQSAVQSEAVDRTAVPSAFRSICEDNAETEDVQEHTAANSQQRNDVERQHKVETEDVQEHSAASPEHKDDVQLKDAEEQIAASLEQQADVEPEDAGERTAASSEQQNDVDPEDAGQQAVAVTSSENPCEKIIEMLKSFNAQYEEETAALAEARRARDTAKEAYMNKLSCFRACDSKCVHWLTELRATVPRRLNEHAGHDFFHNMIPCSH